MKTTTYTAPELEVLSTVVEAGFSYSGNSSIGTTPEENYGDYE